MSIPINYEYTITQNGVPQYYVRSFKAIEITDMPAISELQYSTPYTKNNLPLVIFQKVELIEEDLEEDDKFFIFLLGERNTTISP